MSDHKYKTHWIISATVILTSTVLAALAVVFDDNVRSFTIHEPPSINVHGFTLNYYRAPEHINPPVNLLDPFDSFEKDDNGDLAISSTGTNIFSNFANAVFRGYTLNTRKGNPVIVYQETPSRGPRHKSNCHGLTFLEGDYWLLGSQVQRILDDNDWVIVAESRAAAGDIAVYRESHGRIAHTARVIGRDAEHHILVESKNGFEQKVESIRAVDVVPK